MDARLWCSWLNDSMSILVLGLDLDWTGAAAVPQPEHWESLDVQYRILGLRGHTGLAPSHYA
jgi:hypothetical protein